MFTFIKKILFDCISGIDGVTVDPARLYLAGAVCVFLAGAAVVIFKTHALDFIAFGTGFGALMAGGGLAIAIKSKTEPGEKS